MDEAKEDMIDVVKFLRNPEVFRQVGAKIPKGQMKVMTKVIMEVKKFFITQYSIVFFKTVLFPCLDRPHFSLTLHHCVIGFLDNLLCVL